MSRAQLRFAVRIHTERTTPRSPIRQTLAQILDSGQSAPFSGMPTLEALLDTSLAHLQQGGDDLDLRPVGDIELQIRLYRQVLREFRVILTINGHPARTCHLPQYRLDQQTGRAILFDKSDKSCGKFGLGHDPVPYLGCSDNPTLVARRPRWNPRLERGIFLP